MAGELSPRELEVLNRMFAAGEPTQAEVAAAMHLSPGTVAGYLASAYRKLGVRSLFGAWRALEIASLPKLTRDDTTV